jgi:DNA-binding SARP family transcriptional activator/tetratricopeptide (TPR) repeat protein
MKPSDRDDESACRLRAIAHIDGVCLPRKNLLYVRTLGGLRQRSEGDHRPLRRKPLALLCYLARRAPRAVTRTELATLLWGERGEDRARQSLRQALLELKQTLGDKIDVDADSVRLHDDAVELDIVAFEREMSAGRVHEAVGRWDGDFLEGAEDVGGEGFRRWIENERVALHTQLSAAMGKLIGDAELEGDWNAAAAWAQRWAAALPFDEQAHLRLIEALRMSARSGDALEAHAAFVTRVRTAHDVEPSAEFLRLGGGLAEGARDELARRGRGTAAVHSPTLVGRGPVMSALGDAWRTASDGTSVVVLVEGAKGAGLTRVCDELVARVGADAVVLSARGEPGTDLATASALFDGLRSAEGSAGAAPEALAEVARIVPALAMEFKFLPTPVGDEGALRDALAQTLVAVGEEQPVLVILDDAHAADEATRRLVASLAGRLTGRVMLVLTADEGERQPSQALGILLATRGLRQLRLGELSLTDVEAMLGSMVTLDAAERRALAARLHAESGGVPHDVRELVTALVDDHLLTLDSDGVWRVSPTLAGRPLPVPPAVRERLRARLERLTLPARALAAAIAVLHAPAALAVAGSVAELSADDAEPALGELVARRVIRESAAQPGHYEFASPLVARAAAALLPATRREALHARAAEVLTERDLATTAERSLLPYHLARAASPPVNETASPPARRRRRATLWLALPALVIVGAAAVALHRAGGLGASGSDSATPIVALGRISDYRQATGANLTKPLVDMLATNLGRVGRLRVVSAARMYELVSQAGTPGDTSEAALVRAARRAGATEMLDGALYAREDGGYRLDLRRVELAKGSIKQTYSVSGTTLFELADSGTAHVARDFGETTPLGSIADVTTRSLSAYRLYEQGLRAYYANDRRTAESLFEAALAEDSTFAIAAYYSAISGLQGPRVMLKRFALASRLAGRTTDRERLTILAREASLASSPALSALAETLSVRYPDEVEGYYFTGLSLAVQGQFQRALAPLNRVVAMDSLALDRARALCLACEALQQIVSVYAMMDSLPAAERATRRWMRLQPASPVPWHWLADLMSQSGRPKEAFAALEREAAFDEGRKEAERVLTLAVHRIYAGDFDQADRLLDVERESGSQYRSQYALWYQSISYRQQGRLDEALVRSRRHRAVASALYSPAIGAARRAAPTEALGEAQVLYEMKRYRQSAALFDSISRWVVGDESPSQNAHSRAWALAHAAGSLIAAGDTSNILALIDTIRATGGQSNVGRDQILHHHVRGLLLAARGDDPAAVEELRRAIYSWTFGYTRTNVALAAALLRLHRPKEAIDALQPALRGSIEASNFYVSRTEIHDMLGQAWALMNGPAARDSSVTHYAFAARAWAHADSSFAERRARAEAGSRR